MLFFRRCLPLVLNSANGQYFTPQNICDMMARMYNPVSPTERIFDPACGSGRMLMAMAKVNRFARFYGADVDPNCAKMAVINLCLNSMYGEIAWMNTLTNQYFGGWKIVRTKKGIPCIQEITMKESYIFFFGWKIKMKPLRFHRGRWFLSSNPR